MNGRLCPRRRRVVAIGVGAGTLLFATLVDARLPRAASKVEPVVALTALSAASAASGATLVRWQTGYEIHNLGFYVYREESGQRVRMNPSIIAGSALWVGAAPLRGGRSYAWWDREPGAAHARYWIEAVAMDGRRTWHGPVRAHGPAPATTVAVSPLLSKVPSARDEAAPMRTMSLFGQRAGTIERLPVIENDVQPRLASSGEAIKISVNADGWYRVRRADLAAAGAKSGLLDADPRRLALYTGGREQAIVVVGEADGIFNDADAVEFLGLGLDDIATDRRVYWLVAAATAGKRITTAPAASNDVPTTDVPLMIERRDHKVYYAPLSNGDSSNFFGPVVTREPVDQSVDAHHVTPDREARLEVRLQGVSDKPHRVAVEWGGIRLGVIDFVGQTASERHFGLPPGRVRDGKNTLRLWAEGTDEDVSLVEVVRLSYRHRMIADSGALMGLVPAGSSVRITGFAGSRVRAFDVTVPNAPVEIGGVSIEADGAGWAARIAVSDASEPGTRRLLVLEDRSIMAPVALRVNNPSSLQRGEGAPGGLVVLGPSALVQAVSPLWQKRQRDGWPVTLVDLEDVYDEFAHGHRDRYAIRRFFLAARGWKAPPRAAILVGDASIDPRNHLGFGDFDLVPTSPIPSFYIEGATDDWFADFDGDEIADIPLGRLPVRTETDARRIAARIADFQPGRLGNDRGTAVLVADSDPVIDFVGASRGVRDLMLPEDTVVEIYRPMLTDEVARTRIVEAFALGPRLVNYFGHGTTDLWAAGKLLSGPDVARLSHGGRPPLIATVTCLNGYFHDVYTTSMAESFLLSEGGGALGVIASSVLAEPPDQAKLNRTFVRAVLDGKPLGEALRLAKADLVDPEVRRSYLLFADPTTVLVTRDPVAVYASESGAGCAVALHGGRQAAPLVWLCGVLLSLAMLIVRRRVDKRRLRRYR